MKYLAIDIETTGLNPDRHQMIEFACVLEDTNDHKTPVEDLPSFSKIIYYDEIIGQPYALNLNRDIIQQISEADTFDLDKTKIVENEDFSRSFKRWLKPHLEGNKITLAGKNLEAFDLQFMRKMKHWEHYFGEGQTDMFHRRIIDPAILFVDWKKDEYLPNLQTCLNRAGIRRDVKHTALSDARDIVYLLREKL